MKKITAADGTDYQYDKHGKSWRVRVRLNDRLPANTPVNGDAEVEMSGAGIRISVAALDEDGNVAAAPDGTYRVFPAHVLTIQAEALGKIDPQEEIEKVIQQQIDLANEQLEGKNKLHEALARFA